MRIFFIAHFFLKPTNPYKTRLRGPHRSLPSYSLFPSQNSCARHFFELPQFFRPSNCLKKHNSYPSFSWFYFYNPACQSKIICFFCFVFMIPKREPSNMLSSPIRIYIYSASLTRCKYSLNLGTVKSTSPYRAA